ncbi:hypothetical protein VMT65_07125 [Nocardia sp. CDC153]|uniref:hypothetical protein n=1 Tax=Nocardia sp. CDC153 TaxID=3112167 RepID=UPI002DB6AC65|nr:hypothetical protein [Nocardia sp. CDC153]MEC3952797.1 hypothetical protein [Nocardia sp. CDC153]
MSAAACAVVVLAGCGSGGGSTKSDSAPSTPRDQLVLAESEFPAGTKKMDIPQDKLQSTLADLNGTMANTTVSPAECKGPQVDVAAGAKDILSKSTIALAATEDMTMYVDYVSGQVMDLSKMVENYAKCPEVKATSTVSGQQVDGTTTVAKLSVPAALAGTNAIAYKTTGVSTVGDAQPITRTTYEGYTTLRGLTVGVRITSMSNAPDQAAFDTFFTTAVQKVQNAK